MKRITVLSAVLTVILSACNVGNFQLQPLATPAEEALPAQTAAIEATPEPTQTATPVPTATPDYGDIFKDARLLNMRALNDMDFLIVIETKKDLPAGSLDAFTVNLGKAEYNCTMLEQFVRRLYCVGKPPEVGVEETVAVKVAGVDAPVFETAFTIEAMPVITPLDTLDATQAAAATAEATLLPALAQPSGTPLEPLTPGTLEPLASPGTPGTPSEAEVLQPGGLAGGGMEGVGGGIGPTATTEGESTSQP